MATDDMQILITGVAATPASWTVPGNGQVQPKTIYASYDGTAAGAPFYPAVEIVSDGGEPIGLYPTDVTVAAGGSAVVSWFPGVKAGSGVSGALTADYAQALDLPDGYVVRWRAINASNADVASVKVGNVSIFGTLLGQGGGGTGGGIVGPFMLVPGPEA